MSIRKSIFLYLIGFTFQAIEGGELEAIKPLPWYPKNLAWHSNFSRKQIRKNQTLERYIFTNILMLLVISYLSNDLSGQMAILVKEIVCFGQVLAMMCSSLGIFRFHEFLKLENEVGNMTRQEAVSMVR